MIINQSGDNSNYMTGMQNKSAIIMTDVLTFATVLLWSYYFIDNFWLAVMFTFPVFGLFKTVFLLVSSKLKRNKTPSVGEIFFRLAVLSPKEQSELFFRTLPEDSRTRISDTLFEATLPEGKTVVAVNFKLGETTADDLLKIKRATENTDGKITVLGKFPSRTTLLTAKRFGFSARYPKPKEIKNWLKKHNAIPAPPSSETADKKEKTPFNLSDVLHILFSRSKIKYYLFSATVLGVMSFFVPASLYYLILSGVSACLAIGSAFVPE